MNDVDLVTYRVPPRFRSLKPFRNMHTYKRCRWHESQDTKALLKRSFLGKKGPGFALLRYMQIEESITIVGKKLCLDLMLRFC